MFLYPIAPAHVNSPAIARFRGFGRVSGLIARSLNASVRRIQFAVSLT